MLLAPEEHKEDQADEKEAARSEENALLLPPAYQVFTAQLHIKDQQIERKDEQIKLFMSKLKMES